MAMTERVPPTAGRIDPQLTRGTTRRAAAALLSTRGVPACRIIDGPVA